MTTTTPPVAMVPAVSTASVARKRLTSPWASLFAIIIATLWTLPTLGLFVTSFRDRRAIRQDGWWNAFTQWDFTFDNYGVVLESGSTTGLTNYFINSFVITIPAVLAPMLLAALASYAFAWMEFKGRDTLFVIVFSLQVVPLQIALIPLLRTFNIDRPGSTDPLLNGYPTVWIAHTIFALPLAIFLLHNFMKEIPGELIEAARVDGAGHVRIFFQVLLPLVTPALAAFGIFQFLWVWNDLLVGLTFLGTDVQPITVAISNLSGSRGGQWYLLSAGAFVSIIVPLLVFLALQRYFVRGLLAGGLKG